MNALDTQSLRLHVPVLGWLFVIANAVLLITGLLALILLVGIGLVAQDPIAYRVLVLVGSAALNQGVFLSGVLFALGLIPLTSGFSIDFGNSHQLLINQ